MPGYFSIFKKFVKGAGELNGIKTAAKALNSINESGVMRRHAGNTPMPSPLPKRIPEPKRTMESGVEVIRGRGGKGGKGRGY